MIFDYKSIKNLVNKIQILDLIYCTKNPVNLPTYHKNIHYMKLLQVCFICNNSNYFVVLFNSS